MTKAKLVGIIEEAPYGIPLEYNYGDIFLMNRFLFYLAQHQDAIIENMSTQFDQNVIDEFILKIYELDEYETCYFYNLDTFTTTDIDWGNFELQIHEGLIFLKQNDIQLEVKYQTGLDILFEGECIDIGDIENYNGMIVQLSF